MIKDIYVLYNYNRCSIYILLIYIGIISGVHSLFLSTNEIIYKNFRVILASLVSTD